MKKKLYVIERIGFEYDDQSYHRTYGHEAEPVKAFSDPTKAQEELESLNKQGLSDFDYINECREDNELVTKFYKLVEVEGDIDV